MMIWLASKRPTSKTADPVKGIAKERPLEGQNLPGNLQKVRRKNRRPRSGRPVAWQDPKSHSQARMALRVSAGSRSLIPKLIPGLIKAGSRPLATSPRSL